MPVDKAMNILVVDDYNTLRRIIRNLLGQLGFENIDEVASGSEAMHKLAEKTYALVICEWNIELLQRLRADERFKQLPFIMVTADSKPEQLAVAKQAGVSNYIVKPFNAETLKAKLISVLGEF